MELCTENQCYGCFACVNVCPKKCLTMQEGDNGHIFPHCDTDQCVDCGLCASVCPVLHQPDVRKPSKVYAAWNKDLKQQKKSSSGGAAALLAQKIIEEGGVVYGAAFDETWRVHHIRCETAQEAQRLCRSKYVHSWIENTYSLAQQDLKSGRLVFFTGTPCQIAGLRSFLRTDYENLWTVDLICHGVPSRKLYYEEISQKARLDALRDLTFRGDYGHGFGYGFGYAYKDGTLDSYSIRQSYYMRGFMDGLFCRESCYRCPFAGTERVGDITIGDFWGIGKKIPFENPEKRRVSLLMENTPRGHAALAKIQNQLFMRERTLEEAAEGNPQLQRPSVKAPQYEKFKAKYRSGTLEKAAQSCFPKMRLRIFLEKLHIIKKTF